MPTFDHWCILKNSSKVTIKIWVSCISLNLNNCLFLLQIIPYPCCRKAMRRTSSPCTHCSRQRSVLSIYDLTSKYNMSLVQSIGIVHFSDLQENIFFTRWILLKLIEEVKKSSLLNIKMQSWIILMIKKTYLMWNNDQ